MAVCVEFEVEGVELATGRTAIVLSVAGISDSVPFTYEGRAFEVWSAGRFPTGITPESLKHAHPSVQRNDH